jgi:hypothetical protein
MTGDEIRTEFGWSEDMIRCFLRIPDAPASIRGKHRCDRYSRERVLATAQTREARAAKIQWDETLRGHTPNPGWTTRLGDMGAVLGVSAVAVGNILERLGYRRDKRVTDRAVAAGCGVRRWDGYALHDDWHVDHIISAIRSEVGGKPAVADVLAAAIAKQDRRERSASRKRKQEETETAVRLKEEVLLSGLQVELRALRANDPAMSLLTAVEYITPDPGHQIALYRYCSTEEQRIGSGAKCQDDCGLMKTDASTVTGIGSAARDLRLLERRAKAEGFPV